MCVGSAAPPSVVVKYVCMQACIFKWVGLHAVVFMQIYHQSIQHGCTDLAGLLSAACE